MIDSLAFLDALKKKGTSYFVGVPDSLLQNFCNAICNVTESSRHIIAVNEGAAVGIAAGLELANNQTPLVYMQNSGLGNAVNPLVSLCHEKVYSIPLLLMIGWRGEPGMHDEPQHVAMGSITKSLLSELGIKFFQLDNQTPDDARSVLEDAYKTMRESQSPVALLVKKNTFSEVVLKNIQKESQYRMLREEVVNLLLEVISKDAIIIATTGKLSRELFELREKRGEEHCKDFLTVGSMGYASQIAFGLAKAQPNRRIYCLDGDGAALMHMGGMATIGQHKQSNLTHIIFNNGVHESVGGQTTAGFDVSFCSVAKSVGYASSTQVEDRTSVIKALKDSDTKSGPHLIEIRIAAGSRNDLGRPSIQPAENKKTLKQFLHSR